MKRNPLLVRGLVSCAGPASRASASSAATRPPRAVPAFHAIDLAGTARYWNCSPTIARA